MDSVAATDMKALTWIYCLGHAEVHGNEVADQLTGAAKVDCEVSEDKNDVLKRLTEYLREEEESQWAEHHGIERMMVMNVRKGEGRYSSMEGKARRMENQIKSGTISMTTLRVILERGTEHVWVCPECRDVAP